MAPTGESRDGLHGLLSVSARILVPRAALIFSPTGQYRHDHRSQLFTRQLIPRAAVRCVSPAGEHQDDHRAQDTHTLPHPKERSCVSPTRENAKYVLAWRRVSTPLIPRTVVGPCLLDNAEMAADCRTAACVLVPRAAVRPRQLLYGSHPHSSKCVREPPHANKTRAPWAHNL